MCRNTHLRAQLYFAAQKMQSGLRMFYFLLGREVTRDVSPAVPPWRIREEGRCPPPKSTYPALPFYGRGPMQIPCSEAREGIQPDSVPVPVPMRQQNKKNRPGTNTTAYFFKFGSPRNGGPGSHGIRQDLLKTANAPQNSTRRYMRCAPFSPCPSATLQTAASFPSTFRGLPGGLERAWSVSSPQKQKATLWHYHGKTKSKEQFSQTSSRFQPCTLYAVNASFIGK